MLQRLIKFTLILLAIIGLADCLFIAATINLTSGQCSGIGSCDKVLNSSFSSVMGISLWKIGVAFYILYTSFIVIVVSKGHRRFLTASICLLLSGIGYSLYLIYLQAFVINAWCPLCLLSAGVQSVSLLGCIYLWRTTKEDPTKPTWMSEFLASAILSVFTIFLVLKGSSMLWSQVSKMSHEAPDVVTQLGDETITLSDFPEYMTMQHEFDQFVWNRAKQWYRAKLLSYIAEQKGFASATDFVHAKYIESGGIITIDATETRKRFKTLKDEYLKLEKEMPSDEVLFAELQTRYQKKYNDFVTELTDTVENDLGAKYMLVPPSVNIVINPETMPTIGNDDAPIKIIEISDFHCIHCKKMHGIIEGIREELGEENVQVAYINHYWKTLPKGMTLEEASLTMRTAYAAWKQDQFWEFSNLVFKNQDRINIDAFEDLEELAIELKLDLTKFKADTDSSEAFAFIEAQRPYQEAAFAETPPTLLINGFFVKKNRLSILKKIKELNLLPAL